MILAFQLRMQFLLSFTNSTLVHVTTKNKLNALVRTGYYVRTTYELSGFDWSPKTDTCLTNVLRPKYISIVYPIYALFYWYMPHSGQHTYSCRWFTFVTREKPSLGTKTTMFIPILDSISEYIQNKHPSCCCQQTCK